MLSLSILVIGASILDDISNKYKLEMNQNYIEDFKALLNERGYSGHYNNTNNKIKISGHYFWRVEIKNIDNKIIQVFVLMRNSYRTRKTSFPIWKRYPQYFGENKCLEVNPAVFIVTQDNKGTWSVYSASDTSTPKDRDYIINYEEACTRFDKRVSAVLKYGRMVKTVKCISWSLAMILTAYLIAHIVANTWGGYDLPLSSQMVVLIGMIIILLILPVLLPYTKSLSINGILDIDLDM